MIPSLITSFPTQHFSVWWRGFLKAPSSNLYRIHIESYETAFFELDIAGQARIRGDFPTESDESLSSKVDLESSRYSDIWLEQGSLVPISLKYAQKLGPTKIRLLWESDSIVKTVIEKVYLFHTLGSQTTPFALVVSPAISSALHSSLADNEDYKYAVVDVLETHTLHVRDRFMNQQAHQTDGVKATITDLSVTPAAPVVATVTAKADGEWRIEYTLTTASSKWSMAIEI